MNNASHAESPAHVLIVDDDLDIRTLLAEYLQDNGCHPLLAADGTAMWQALASHTVDLVVLDLNLPGVDGLALCTELRAKSDLPIAIPRSSRPCATKAMC